MQTEQPANGAAAPIEVEPGQTFTLTLEANPSTGYQWELARPLDRATVQLVGSEFHAGASGLPGAPGAEVWTFRAVGGGTSQIALRYARPWERDTPPQTTREFVVLVR